MVESGWWDFVRGIDASYGIQLAPECILRILVITCASAAIHLSVVFEF